MTEFKLWCIYIVGGFLCGSIMFCKIIPQIFKKIDVCAVSDDGNPGAANVFTACGVWLGLLCLALDMLKGFLPVFLALRHLNVTLLPFAAVIVAPALGHALGIFNHFHGGKCIATIFGETLALLPVTVVVILLAALYILFSAIVKIRPIRRCSLVTFIVFGILGALSALYHGMLPIAIGIAAISALAVYKHLPPRKFPEPTAQASDEYRNA